MCYSALIQRDLDYLERKFSAIAVREQIADYEQRSMVQAKQFPKLSDRIYPGYYAPVIFKKDDQRYIELMRYSAYPPSFIADTQRYTTYNARRDNLTSHFWSESFGKHHGFVVLKGFYEWVAVKELLKAKTVTLEQIKADFHRLSEERRARIMAQGKRYKPTATEAKDPLLRKVIIQFQAEKCEEFIVPVIFSSNPRTGDTIDKGFAIVTDDPPKEVLAAGHDRCPIILKQAAIDTWLHSENFNEKNSDFFLNNSQAVSFQHRLPASG